MRRFYGRSIVAVYCTRHIVVSPLINIASQPASHMTFAKSSQNHPVTCNYYFDGTAMQHDTIAMRSSVSINEEQLP